MAAASAVTAGPAVDRRLRTVRFGLVLLGAGQAIAAIWALAAPRAFYDSFPFSGAHWVSALPPFNEHLVRDYGASFLALSVLALLAAWYGEARLMRVALIVWIVAALPHLAFHIAHADEPGGGDGVLSLLTLGLNFIVPVSLLFLIPKEVPK